MNDDQFGKILLRSFCPKSFPLAVSPSCSRSMNLQNLEASPSEHGVFASLRTRLFRARGVNPPGNRDPGGGRGGGQDPRRKISVSSTLTPKCLPLQVAFLSTIAPNGQPHH